MQRCSKLNENNVKEHKFPMDENVLVTCGLPYVNGPCHIAHLRTYVPADIFVRFLRKMGQEVVFICGSDTHGTPITIKAEELGVTPYDVINKYHSHFLEFFPFSSHRCKPLPLFMLLNYLKILKTDQGGYRLISAGDYESFMPVRTFGYKFR